MHDQFPEVVFFDAADTLIELCEPVGLNYSRIAAAHGFRASAGDFETAFRAAWKAAGQREPVAGPRPEDDRGWWRDLVVDVFGRLGLPRENGQFEACFDAMYLYFAEPGVWRLFPDVKETLDRLGNVARLAVISNFDGRLRRILEDLEVSGHFEAVFVSSEIGADKPHPEIFTRALSAMRVPAEAALHVGDHPELDWRAAARAGLRVFELRRPETSLRSLLAGG